MKRNTYRVIEGELARQRFGDAVAGKEAHFVFRTKAVHGRALARHVDKLVHHAR